jgi:ABC-2 type transport system permease protein
LRLRKAAGSMPMFSAVIAEFLKLRRHTATWLLVWIYPIAIGLLNLLMIGHDLFGGPAAPKGPSLAAGWIDQTALILSLPMTGQGRWLIAGFAAVAFAGEYGWNTWKLVIPARERWQLIVAKWIVVMALICLALVLADLIMLGGALLRPVVGGDAVPAGVTGGAIVAAHAEALGRIWFPLVYTVAWAGLLAILTRSMLATAIASIVVISLEQAHALLAVLASGWVPGITRVLLEVLPLYHAANLTAQVKGGPAAIVPLADGIYSASWGTSLTIVLVWILGLSAATLAIFQRQDMN